MGFDEIFIYLYGLYVLVFFPPKKKKKKKKKKNIHSFSAPTPPGPPP